MGEGRGGEWGDICLYFKNKHLVYLRFPAVCVFICINTFFFGQFYMQCLKHGILFPYRATVTKYIVTFCCKKNKAIYATDK